MVWSCGVGRCSEFYIGSNEEHKKKLPAIEMLLYVAWSNAILAIHRVRLAQMKTSRLMGSKVKDWLLLRQNLKIYSKFTYGIFKLQGECDIKNTAPTMVHCHASVFYNLRILPPNWESIHQLGGCAGQLYVDESWNRHLFPTFQTI